MKSVNFFGTIQEESNILFAQAKKDFLEITNDFSIKAGNDQFTIKDIKNEELWIKFDKVSLKGETFLSLQESADKTVFRKDVVEIVLENNPIDERVLINNPGKGYEKNDVLYWTKYEGECHFLVEEVDENGGVKSLSVNNVDGFCASTRYISINPEGGSGEELDIEIKIQNSSVKKTLEKTIKTSIFQNRAGYINFEYPLDEGVEDGEIKIKRTTITLNENCTSNYNFGITCLAQVIEFTPKLNIPIVKKGTINAYNLYNEGSSIIEDKLIELENRIIELENKL